MLAWLTCELRAGSAGAKIPAGNAETPPGRALTCSPVSILRAAGFFGTVGGCLGFPGPAGGGFRCFDPANGRLRCFGLLLAQPAEDVCAGGGVRHAVDAAVGGDVFLDVDDEFVLVPAGDRLMAAVAGQAECHCSSSGWSEARWGSPDRRGRGEADRRPGGRLGRFTHDAGV